MKQYHECPTQNCECPYWDWKHHKCAMELMTGDSPSGQCDEFDAYKEDENEDNEEEDEE